MPTQKGWRLRKKFHQASLLLHQLSKALQDCQASDMQRALGMRYVECLNCAAGFLSSNIAYDSYTVTDNLKICSSWCNGLAV